MENEKSPLTAAFEEAEADGPDNQVNLLARLLMCYHDFDREMCKKIWEEQGYEFFSTGVDRKNKGYFLHAQYLAGVP